ncbi:mitogen-activated protein kinase kinase kinase 3-like isoform X1 [Aristolochia californica]|uniref:mitogen-activated protein kinase kinase kinase 3-like isoform X1 n=1 Tax=Aristolochia californica TaxID=171875 RepID=UPI0035DB8052
MPAWIWGKKSSASKKKEEEHHYHHRPEVKDSRRAKEKPKSFDEIVARGKNAMIVGSSSSGFDSDGFVQRRGHPLPPPALYSSLGHDQGVVSGSISSVSSSGSSDDPPDLGFVYRYQDQISTPSGRTIRSDPQRQQQITENGYPVPISPSDHSRFPELSTSPRSEFHLTGSTPRASLDISFNPRSRSPGPVSRPQSRLSSPLHPRLAGINPDSPTERPEDGKTQGHPLPLPPGSPNSSSSPHVMRSNGVQLHENGQTLRSKWKKGRLLGRGTFGHVYVGFNSESGQMCAIKEVRVITDDQNSKECLRQLNQEITLLSQLSHPNIVRYHGSELAEDTLSVYLEYVSGGSIHKLLQEYGPFKEPVIQSYAGQILSGLAYLHGRNTVHRDIKGANILVDPNGEIKLADFGMAKHINTCGNVLSFKGSPYWMAPEVIMNISGYNLAVDIWSLGCTILEMATSKPPWSQYEGVAAIFKIGNSKDVPEIPDHLSDDGKNFLRLCLQRDPSARPTAVQLLEHPFVRGHSHAKVPKFMFSKELQFPTDGPHSPQSAAEFQSLKLNTRSYDGDYGMRGGPGYSNGFTGSSSNDGVRARMNMSLPVSPCSSPLRQFGPAYKSFLTPPHPTYTMAMGGYGYVTHPVLPRMDGNPVRLDDNYPDIWPETPQRCSRTPDGSPRGRQMRNMFL